MHVRVRNILYAMLIQVITIDAWLGDPDFADVFVLLISMSSAYMRVCLEEMDLLMD